MSRSQLLAVIVCMLAWGAPPSQAQEWQTAIRAGDYALALRELDSALAADPNDTSLRYERARTLGFSGETESALAAFDALVADYPDDADYLLGRAQMQTRLGRTAAAIETAERCGHAVSRRNLVAAGAGRSRVSPLVLRRLGHRSAVEWRAGLESGISARRLADRGGRAAVCRGVAQRAIRGDRQLALRRG
jgi:tetratricopeptide (TPR) repeat protein